MSEDEKLRQLDRREVANGRGPLAHLRTLVGSWVYVEGARLNYRGLLKDVMANERGQPEALILEPGYRVGDWGRQGPDSNYEIDMGGPRYVPYATILEIGKQPDAWAKK